MIELQGRRILVTGGCGFIGRALVRALVQRNASVRCLDNDSRGSWRKLDDVSASVEFCAGDIRDARFVREAMRGMDAVCHLASINGTEYFYEHPELVLEVAVKGMMNVLDACVAEGVRDLVLASSSEVYQTAASIPTAEDVPLVVPDVRNPRYSYGGGKIISELLALNYGRSQFDRVAIFRPHNVYGPDMGGEHVIPQFVRRMIELGASDSGPAAFPIQGSGQETRAFIFIDDCIDGALRVITHGEHMGIYHVGTQDEVTIAEVARMIAACLNVDIRLVTGPLTAGSTLRRCPDIGRLRALGFVPATPLAQGIATTVAWYKEHHGAERHVST